MLQSLQDQLGRYRPYISTTVEACNELRATLVEDLSHRLDVGDEQVMNALLSYIDDNGNDDERSVIDKCRDELKLLENPLSPCGIEFASAFGRRYDINVVIFTSAGRMKWAANEELEIDETAVIWQSAADHYDSVVNWDDYLERQRTRKRKSARKRRLDAQQ